MDSMAQDAVAPVATAEGGLPPRPVVPERMSAFMKKWWRETDNVPDLEVAIRAARECQKTMFPAWFDRSDKFRGLTPQELRSRKDDRRVRTNLAYKNILQTVAMTVPEDHGIKWEAEPLVGSEQGVADPAIDLLAQTLVPVVKTYTREAGFQEVVQSWVQDACQYRLAIMKVVFDRTFVDDTIRAHQESRDQQDNIERLRVLVEDYHRNVFNKDDDRFQEILTLKQSLSIDGDLKVWAGLRCELVPLDCFRFDPSIRGFENVYNASWMAHDVLMSVDEIRAKYPFRLTGENDWTGVHPDDITEALRHERRDRPSFGVVASNREKGKGPNPTPDSEAEAHRILVREIWIRKLGRVFVFVEGVDYPVASWSPEKGPAQWYPFRLLRLNRVTGQVYGISDVELMAEIQHRINRKRSDEEKARWLALPRGIYNTQGIDQNEALKMRDQNPGEWKGVNLAGAKSIKEVMEQFSFQFDPNSFDTSKDEYEMQLMAALPSQMLGATGQANYSSEVEAGMQGAAISAAARGNIIRRALEGTYDMIAEILLQELTYDDVVQIAGPQAFWPRIYSETEAKTMEAQLLQQVQAGIEQQQQQDLMLGEPPLPEPIKQQALADGMRTASLGQFGWERPVSREVLFRFMHCKVSVSLNAQADRAQRIKAMSDVFAALQMGAQAAASAGMIFDPAPLLRQVAPLFNGDTDIAKMFVRPPPMMPGAVPPGGGPALPPQVAGQNAPQPNAGEQAVANMAPPDQSANTPIQPVHTPGNNV